MHNKKIAIICNGESITNLKEVLNDIDIIIAADGGANICYVNNITPHYIIGDLDSLNYKEKMHASKIIKISDQNTTDLQKALQYIEQFHPSEIRLISLFGKRLDHEIANLLILTNYHGNADLKAYSKYGILQCFLPGEHKIKVSKIGELVSLFSLEKISGLEINGFKFELENKDFEPNFIGISNTIINKTCRIKFVSGKLLFFRNY